MMWGGPEGLRSRAVQSMVRGVLRPIAAGGRKSRPPLPSGRRLLLLHLDGVGRSQLDCALREGYLPNVAQLLDSGRYAVSSCRAGVPTSTPVFQAGLLYGCQADIPGYVWYDKRRRRAVRMDSYEDARRMQHESQFLFHRVLTECLFSEFAANATVIDVARGTPIVYACFIGYDEYAHRRGPYSHMAMLKLFELDRALGRILAAVDAVPELGYEVYLFSDHGQAATRPAEQIVGESLGEHLLSDTPSAGEHVRPIAFGGAGGGDAAAAAAHARWLRALSRSLPGALGKAALGWARHTAKALDAAQPARIRAEGPLLVVPAGDIAHVYSTEVP